MNYDTHQYEPMPPVRRDFAIVLWCRPGSGEAKALQVPIDLGWVGARIAENNRAWHQQKIVISEYFPGTGLAPAVVPQAQVIASAITPEGRAAPNAFMSGVADVRALAQQSNGQGPLEQAAQQIGAQGIAAQVGQIVDQAIASGQQLTPEQVAQLNTQAAAVVTGNAAPQQPATAVDQRPPGVPPGMVGHGPAGTPARYPGYENTEPQATAQPLNVPAEQPPTPKAAGKNTPPLEYVKELIERSSAGIDTEAFYIEMVAELTTLSKKDQLQPMLRHIKPGIDEALLRKHREPLAQMLVEEVKKQREIRTHGQPTTQDTQAQQSQEVGTPAAQIPVGPAWGSQPPVDGIVDMTYEGVIRAINEAPSVDRLTAIYRQWTATYGPEQWTGIVLETANARLAHLQLVPTH
jgi:hypothetical protein